MSSQAPRHLKSILAENIRAARLDCGLTQLQLSQRLGMDQMNISRWERGKVTPSLENFAALADVLGRDLAWFYVDRTEAAA